MSCAQQGPAEHLTPVYGHRARDREVKHEPLEDRIQTSMRQNLGAAGTQSPGCLCGNVLGRGWRRFTRGFGHRTSKPGPLSRHVVTSSCRISCWRLSSVSPVLSRVTRLHPLGAPVPLPRRVTDVSGHRPLSPGARIPLRRVGVEGTAAPTQFLSPPSFFTYVQTSTSRQTPRIPEA